MAFLALFQNERSFSETEISYGNTRVTTVFSGSYNIDGQYDVDFEKTINANANFGLKTFYQTHFNPIEKYNDTFKLDTISSSFIQEAKIQYLSTFLISPTLVTWRGVSSPPFYFEGLVDTLYINNCPQYEYAVTAKMLDEPNYEINFFSDVYEKVFENDFVIEATTTRKFYPFLLNNGIFSFSRRILKAQASTQFKNRIFETNTTNPLFETNTTNPLNLSLFRDAMNTQVANSNLFFDYSIMVAGTLKSISANYPEEYFKRQSGLQGMVLEPIYINTNSTDTSSLDKYPHSIYEIATINSNDTLIMNNKVALQHSTITYNNPGAVGCSFIDYSVDNIFRFSLYGNDYFFQDKVITMSFSGAAIATSYCLSNDKIIQSGIVYSTFSTILNNGDFLGVERLCAGKRNESDTNDGDLFVDVNAVTRNCYPEIHQIQVIAFGIENLNYLDTDYVLVQAAKNINTLYYDAQFNDSSWPPYHNNFISTYWSNNLT